MIKNACKSTIFSNMIRLKIRQKLINLLIPKKQKDMNKKIKKMCDRKLSELRKGLDKELNKIVDECQKIQNNFDFELDPELENEYDLSNILN